MHHHDTFHKMLPLPAWHAYKQYRPGANKKYNRPVPALKKHNHPVPSRLEKRIQPPRPASEKKYNRPVPPRKKIQPPRPASGKKTDRPVPPRKKKKTAPSRLEKKNNRPVPPRILPRKIPSRPVPRRISAPIFCQSSAPAEMKKVGQPSIFPPSCPVEILAVHVKPWLFFCSD